MCTLNEPWLLLPLQCSNESVLAAMFHPMDTNLIVTCGKSHINFWTMEGNTLTKRQGLFEVRGLLWLERSLKRLRWTFSYLSVSLQKHEKPKYVLCVAFAENGDAITGDSGGNIYIWAKGTINTSQPARSRRCTMNVYTVTEKLKCEGLKDFTKIY